MKTHLRISLFIIASILAANAKAAVTVPMTASDLMTKALGVIEAHITKEQCADCSRALLGLLPQEDETGFWLTSADGFSVSYDGQTPEVTARALYDGDELASFAYFFIFPSNRSQTRFCGALLQELADLGLTFDMLDSDSLFDICADYEGNSVSIRLLDEAGQYVLAVNVDK